MIIKNYFNKTPLTRTLFFLVSDAILIALAVFLAFLLRFDVTTAFSYFEAGVMQKIIFLALVFCLPIFYLFRLYSFSWSYASVQEILSLFKALTIAFLLLGLAIFFSGDFPGFIGLPRSVFFITYFLVFIFCGWLRLSKRIYFLIVGAGKSGKSEKTLIVGAGDAGEQILRSIISSKDSPYEPAGFIDDSRLKQGVSIHGIKVLGRVSDIPKIAKARGIKQLIIAMPSGGSNKIREAVEMGKKAGIWKIKIAPPMSEIIRGQVSVRNLKGIDIGDLLGRREVLQDQKQIESFVKNKKIMITGAAGSIGSELCRQTAKFQPSQLLMLDQDETGIFNISEEIGQNYNTKTKSFVADIKDKEKIRKIFLEFKPDIVFHAAAYKHVPLMEDWPDEAVKNNVFGTKNVADAAVEAGVAKFILISTDKAVNPSSIMGATKRMCEMICQANNQQGKTKFVSVRFGNVLNSRGSVIPIFKEQIKKGGPVTVTHPEMKRYFMLTSEACLLVMQAGAMGEGGEVYILDMGEPIKILDLAREMIRLSGFEPDKDIAIVFTKTRPGEKLFEEILTAEEGTVATKSKEIFMAKTGTVDKEKIEAWLQELKDSAGEANIKKITEFFKLTGFLKE